MRARPSKTFAVLLAGITSYHVQDRYRYYTVRNQSCLSRHIQLSRVPRCQVVSLLLVLFAASTAGESDFWRWCS